MKLEKPCNICHGNFSFPCPLCGWKKEKTRKSVLQKIDEERRKERDKFLSWAKNGLAKHQMESVGSFTDEKTKREYDGTKVDSTIKQEVGNWTHTCDRCLETFMATDYNINAQFRHGVTIHCPKCQQEIIDEKIIKPTPLPKKVKKPVELKPLKGGI